MLPVSQNKTHCSLAWRLVGLLVDFCSRKVSRQLLTPKIKNIHGKISAGENSVNVNEKQNLADVGISSTRPMGYQSGEIRTGFGFFRNVSQFLLVVTFDCFYTGKKCKHSEQTP